jgi:cell pole-organizing protein PopZ
MTPADQATSQAEADPSMEDVLASIRRILDDGTGSLPPPPVEAIQPEPAPSPPPPPAPAAVVPPAPAQVAPAPPAPAPAPEVFILEPAMMIEEPAPMPPAPMPQASAEQPAMAAYPLIAPETQNATSGSLSDLVRTLSERQTQIYRSGPTLEDIVRDEMRPIIKAWLDTNLPPMVERLVRDEIERVVNRVVGL